MPSNAIIIKPNVPLYVSLADPEGRYDFTTEKGYYQTTDGRTLELPEPAVIMLNVIGPKPGEEIQITKHWTGKHREFPTWTIALSTKSEQARALAESTDTLAEDLAASIAASEARRTVTEPPTPIRKPAKREPVPETQPRLFDQRGTGTHGPAPAVIPVTPPVNLPMTASGLRKEREPIPANVANREILQFIESDPNTKNWSDQAKQDLLSTYIIAFTKTKQIGLWERGGQ